jgi:hypothetical protein
MSLLLFSLFHSFLDPTHPRIFLFLLTYPSLTKWIRDPGRAAPRAWWRCAGPPSPHLLPHDMNLLYRKTKLEWRQHKEEEAKRR